MDIVLQRILELIDERGGWKTDATMKKVYTHAFDQSRREADAIIDGVFEGIIGKITHENTHAEK